MSDEVRHALLVDGYQRVVDTAEGLLNVALHLLGKVEEAGLQTADEIAEVRHGLEATGKALDEMRKLSLMSGGSDTAH
jgi:hypothetical protein